MAVVVGGREYKTRHEDWSDQRHAANPPLTSEPPGQPEDKGARPTHHVEDERHAAAGHGSSLLQQGQRQ